MANRSEVAIVASLLFATAVCGALLGVRALYTRNTVRFNLLWNLFLAWLPMLSALLAHHLHKQGRRLVWPLIVPCLLFWLLFFPNAPYILTDMLHLQWPQARVPVWYDLILLIAFAWTGAFLGLISLFLVHGLVRQWAGRVAGWLVTLGVLAVSGFGVYLGRFPRWNSWDLLTNPTVLLRDIWARISNPLAHSHTFIFSALFSLCLAMMYLMLVAVARFSADDRGRTED
ncbi:MAG: hypothetical protein BWY52_00313 [Chloroflexi bacterium ADurb.Bin325]|nr:MAG: hypothetical protein BWY52_00313 [Chloroflexi bacterium ADurb.Bin325]